MISGPGELSRGSQPWDGLATGVAMRRLTHSQPARQTDTEVPRYALRTHDLREEAARAAVAEAEPLESIPVECPILVRFLYGATAGLDDRIFEKDFKLVLGCCTPIALPFELKLALRQYV